MENENDAVLSIETKKYPNGNLVKRCVLSTGKTAVCRELTGADCIEADKITQKEPELATAALMAVATRIDDKPIVVEDLLILKARDFTRIKAMTVALNFM